MLCAFVSSGPTTCRPTPNAQPWHALGEGVSVCKCTVDGDNDKSYRQLELVPQQPLAHCLTSSHSCPLPLFVVALHMTSFKLNWIHFCDGIAFLSCGLSSLMQPALGIQSHLLDHYISSVLLNYFTSINHLSKVTYRCHVSVYQLTGVHPY